MKRLLIEPLDVLMFRSERPFTARESHVAKLGVISTLTFEGALKSKILSEFCRKNNYLPSDFQRRKNENENYFKNRIQNEAQKNKELKEVLEAIAHPALNSKSSINVLGVFFTEKGNEEEWFPIPNDIVEKEENDKILMLNPAVKNELKIPETECYVCFSTYSKIKSKTGIISFRGLTKYLSGNEPDKSEIREMPYGAELRTGIRIEKRKKTTVEGHLYTAEFLRLKDWKENWKFVVWYEDSNNLIDKYIKSNPLIRFGGEGKGALCRTMHEIDLNKKIDVLDLINKINEEKRFKLYLASPSYFGDYKLITKELEGQLGDDELKLTLVGALPGKPIYIGGYNFAMNKEKPLKRWANAGAIYYYEFDGEIRNDLTLPIKIIDEDENINMRCAFIGRWQKCLRELW